MGKKLASDVMRQQILTIAVVFVGFGGILYMMGAFDKAPAPATIIPTISYQPDAVSLDVKASRMYSVGTSPVICAIAKDLDKPSEITEYEDISGETDFQYNPGTRLRVCVVEDDNSGDGDFACTGETTSEATYDYYASCVDYTIPANAGTAADLTIVTAREGTAPTFTGLDGATSVITDSNTGNLSLVAGGNDLVDMEIKMGSDVCFGTPLAHSALAYSGIVVCEYNKSKLDELIFKDDGSPNSDPWDKLTTPGQHSAGSGNETVSYGVPFDMCDAISKDFDVYVEADSTNAPVGLNHIHCTIYDVGFYINADTDAWVFGVEDEDDNDVGQATHATFDIFLA